MDINQLLKDVENLKRQEQIDFIKRNKSQIVWNKNEHNKLIENVKHAIVKKQKNKAFAAVAFGIIFDVNFIDIIKKKAVFRGSSYEFLTDNLLLLVEDLIAFETSLEISAPAVKYFQSLASLYKACRSLQVAYKGVKQILKSEGMKIIKELIVLLDFIFMTNPQPGINISNNNLINHCTKEDLASGFSYIFYLYSELAKQVEANCAIDTKRFFKGNIEQILYYGVIISEYRDIEIRLDAFGYHLEPGSSPSDLNLIGPVTNFEKFTQVGYIISAAQDHLKFKDYSSKKEQIASLVSLSKRLYQEIGAKHTKLMTNPVERYAFAFPYTPPLQELIQSNLLFLEEAIELEPIAQDLLISLDELLEIKIWKDLDVTLFDLIRVQRWIIFIMVYTQTFLEEKLQTETERVLQSLVPCWTDANLKTMLSIAVDEKKVGPIVDALTWRPDGKVNVFDIQYQPIVRISDGKLIPLHLMASANVIRNSLMISGYRHYNEGTIDPVSKMLCNVLSKHITTFKDNIVFKGFSGGKEGDIDVAAYFNGALFLMECKNSLHPCNSYELRTSYDYVKKAAIQLDNIVGLIRANEDFRKFVSQATGLHFTIPADVRITTSIVMSNRMFTGHREGGHPVRGLFELAQFIHSGKIIIHDQIVNLWAGDKFTSEDLRRYLEEDSGHLKFFNALVEDKKTLLFGEFSISSSRYVLPFAAIAEQFGVQISSVDEE